MTLAQIQRTQERVGTVPDGFWGPKSIAACKAHLRAIMPSPAPFPAQSGVTEFYGPHGTAWGDEPPMKAIKIPFPVYYNGIGMMTLKAHEKCADSLLRVFIRLAEVYPSESKRHEAGITIFDGIYNPRPMRGGNAWSMHAWAIAIDLDAARNGNNTPWPTAAHMPIEVMECFAREGWTAAGAFWSRDSMHFQSTSP